MTEVPQIHAMPRKVIGNQLMLKQLMLKLNLEEGQKSNLLWKACEPIYSKSQMQAVASDRMGVFM